LQNISRFWASRKMPLVLVAVGIALLIAAVRGTLQTGPNGTPGLLTLFYDDFIGPGNFFAWIAAIALIGAVGYYKPLRPVSQAFMILLIVVFVLAAQKKVAGGFFGAFNQQLVTGTSQATTTQPGGGQSLGGGLASSAAASLAPVPQIPGLNNIQFNPTPIGG
jgi:hypothetical protein